MDRSSRQKINKETEGLNEILDQLDLIDTYRAFYPNAADYTFFSRTHGEFSRIDYMLGHKARLGTFKTIKIMPGIFSNHNAIRSDIIYKKITGKGKNTWRLNIMLLNNQLITEKIKRKSKNT